MTNTRAGKNDGGKLDTYVRPPRSRRYVGEAVLRAEDEACCKGAADSCRTSPRRTQPKSASSAPRSRTPSCARFAKNARWRVQGDRRPHGGRFGFSDDVLPCVDMIPGTLDVRHRVIARDRVRYVGQAVALVVAANRYLAEDAAALVEIDYESLPPVTDHMAAMNPGAPLLYPELGTNVVYQ
jgi:hypothetical protein